jgi:polyisoprenoid-binding protein YceI
MKLARTGFIAAVVLAVASVAFAQAKPDFSGTWTLDPAASGMDAAAGGGGGRQGGGGRGMMGPMTVKVAGGTMTVERAGMGGNTMTTTYKLDGTESVNKQTMGRGENAREVELKSTAKWDGAKLVISTQRPGQGGEMMTSTETWSLDGGNLVIETTGGRGGGKRVYKKTT